MKKTNEPENFTKIVKSTSGQLAIIDAQAIKNLDNPAVTDAVSFSTKRSPNEEVYFKIEGTYDDASLQSLKMTIATPEEVFEHNNKKDEKEKVKESIKKDEQVLEGVQLRGHDRLKQSEMGDTVQKKIAKTNTIAKGGKGLRRNRNKLYSKKNRPPVDPAKEVSSRIAEKVGGKGAENDNFGQPRSKMKVECLELIKLLKNGGPIELFMQKMEYLEPIRENFIELRSKTINENGPNLDLIHQACQLLNEQWDKTFQDRMKSIEEIINKR